jgi:formylglycine-generating enzyme required for sulfatase activity
MEPVTVFISYSHDRSEHSERVLNLSERLRQDNISTIIDTDFVKQPKSRPAWMRQQIKKADFILIVCTENYRKSFLGKGRTKWKGPIINQKLFEEEIARNFHKDKLFESYENKFIPVTFNVNDLKSIPKALKNLVHYNLSEKDGYKELVMRLNRIEPSLQQSSRSDRSDYKVQPPTKDAPTVEQESNEPSLVETHIGGYNIHDQPVSVDSLGFEPYTTAIASFLSHKHTQTPLTISVEGEWGSGKSSFMLQLQKKLNKLDAHTVEFSPWRHDKEEVLWAAFVLTFIDKLTEDLGWLKATIANFKLLWKRFDWQACWLQVLKVVLKLLVYLLTILFIIFWATKSQFIKDMDLQVKLFLCITGAGAGLGALVLKELNIAKEYVSNPFKHDLKKYVDASDYASRISFLEKFHKNFENIVKVYAEGKRVYVFIDDLDRCEVPRAAELMKGINLMIQGNPRLIFIIGMDRKKVAAGLAIKDEKLIRFLRPEISGKKKDQIYGSFWRDGLRYGYDFIEKFIQLQFILPRPKQSDIDNLMDDIIEKSREETERKKAAPGIEIQEGYNDLREDKIPNINVLNEPKAEPLDTPELKEPRKEQKRKEKKRELDLALWDDSEQVRNIVHMVDQFIDFSPRRIKQFINLFRLRAYIAWETDLLVLPEYMSDTTGITLEQLGKIVAISLRWPLFLESIDQDKELLKELSEYAEGEKNINSLRKDIARHYAQDNQLMELIRFRCVRAEAEPNEWSSHTLSRVKIDKILQVSPKIRNIEQVSLEFIEIEDVEVKDVNAEASDKVTIQDAVNTEIYSKTTPSFYHKYEYDAEYILILGGQYTNSVTKKTETIPDIYFAKYPVTNKQYRRFIRYLEGKEEELLELLPKDEFESRMIKFASKIEGLVEDLGYTPASWAEKLQSKHNTEEHFERDDQPVVGVSWFGARAYCLWLSLLETTHRKLSSSDEVTTLYRLPTEVEWEWAAAQGKLEYPWISEEGSPTDKLTNYNKKVGITTPFVRYPKGGTLEGAMDIDGNVGEWMENWQGNKSSFCSSHGGSWHVGKANLSCTVHNKSVPENELEHVGFRVICTHPWRLINSVF